MDPKTIAAFVAAGLSAPVLGYLAHCLIDWHKTRKAHAFLEADPLVYEGARFRKLLTAEGGHLMGPGRVVAIEPGRVLVQSSDGAVSVPFDGVEFKSMYPQWLEGSDSAAAAPGLPPRPSGREEAYS